MSAVNCTNIGHSYLQQILSDFSKRLSSMTIDEKIAEKAKPVFDQIMDQLIDSPIRLKRPRDICTLHKHLMKITENVKESESVKYDWEKILKELHKHKILTIGHSLSEIDCSSQLKILKGKSLPQITIEKLNVKNPSEMDKMIHAMVELDEESLGTFIQPGFYKGLLLNPNTLCFAAKTQNSQIAGWLWGSLLTIRGMQIFHVWGVARRANLPGIHLTDHFFHTIKPILTEQKVDYFTFAVFSENVEAIRIFKELGAHIPESSNEKIFVTHLMGDKAFSHSPPSRDEVWAEMKNHVIASLSYWSAVGYEVQRHAYLLWRKVRYSDCWPAAWH